MGRREMQNAEPSGPFNFRGCDLRAEWLLAREHVRVQFPATAPFEAPNFRLQRPEKLLERVLRIALGVAADVSRRIFPKFREDPRRLTSAATIFKIRSKMGPEFGSRVK